MSSLDWIILILLIFAFISGLKMGFIYKLGSLFGTIVGIILAGRYYDSIDIFFGGGIGGKIAAFLAIIAVTGALVGLVFRMIDKVFKIIAVIPGLKSVNRLFGAVLSVMQRTAFVSITVFFLNKFHGYAPVENFLDASRFAPTFIWIGNLISPLLPLALQQIQSLL